MCELQCTPMESTAVVDHTICNRLSRFEDTLPAEKGSIIYSKDCYSLLISTRHSGLAVSPRNVKDILGR